MPKLQVPVLVKDPEVVKWKGIDLTQPYVIDGEEFFLDGPVSRRVAMLDFDPRTGALVPGARHLRSADKDQPDTFMLPRGIDLRDPAFMQVATFGGVSRTVAMFEERDTLGRRVEWGFKGPQLLVVPRAGEWANAFYERESRSLQFFYFTPEGGGADVFTCHSQDIIAHETAHSMIDAVAPDLYDSASPESLAIHEGVADLATLIMAFRSRELANRVLEQTGGSLGRPSAFTAIAEQFGSALRANRHALRDLDNKRTMKDPDLDRGEPHALSEVLSGALYKVMVRIYDALRAAPAEEAPAGRVAVRAEYERWARSGDPSSRKFQAGDRAGASPGRALFVGGERFKRMVLRGLDYLPPGEVTFADFARAILASDEASHPDSGDQRKWLAEEFVRRAIVRRKGDLDVETNFQHRAVGGLDLDELMRSDWLAYRFADDHRKFLGIPPEGPFEVRPRLDVTKRYYHRDGGRQDVRECLFKIAWSRTEPITGAPGLPAERRFTRGTTLAIDWESRRVRAVVTGRGEPGARGLRDAFLAGLVARDILRLGPAADGPDGRPLRRVVRGNVAGGTLRLLGTARALHMLAERGAPVEGGRG
jgi:hypothetical protein